MTPPRLNDLDDSKIGIRGYFERILVEREKLDAERDRRLDERFEAQDKAVLKAETAARETLKAHNDLIRQSRDRDATYATQKDLDHVTEGLDLVRSFQSKILGALALSMVVMPTVTAVIVYLLSQP